MSKIMSFLRVKEWLTSKVTLMVGILLFFSYVNKTSLGSTLREAVVYFFFVSMFLAFSYVSNDFSDIEIDKKAGKKKVIAGMPQWLVFLSLFLMMLVGNIPIVLISNKRILCVIVIVLTYFLGLAYSTLGIRFKEKGIWGLIECSFAQRCMPLLMIAFLESMKGLSKVYLVGWLVVSFLDGLRYILIHQILDMDNDIKSGVKTFVTTKKNNYKKIIILFLVLEVLIVTGLMIQMWIENAIIMGIVYVFYILFEFCIYMVLNVYAKKDWFVTFDSVPLEAFLNVVFPVIIGFFMVQYLGWPMLIYSIVVLIICFRSLKIKIDLATIFIKSKIRKH